MNVNHEQRVIIDQQHFVQNKALIQTHDPVYTEMFEQTAEARHRMAIASRSLNWKSEGSTTNS